MKLNIVAQGLALTSLVLTSTLTVNLDPSVAQSNPSDQVTFKCVQIHDPASNKKIPATIVWIPERKENVRLIGWKSEYFDKTLSADQRCQKVTQKFQTKYDNGDLQYLTLGENNGYPIICGVKNKGDRCNGESQLFTLKLHSNPQVIVERLSGIFGGNLGGVGVLYQGSGDPVYIPFKDVLKESPVIHPTDNAQ